jgi:hypothetical protein
LALNLQNHTTAKTPPITGTRKLTVYYLPKREERRP